MAKELVLDAPSEDEALKLPSGRSLVVVTVRGHGLYKIGFTDGQPGNLPERYQGRYTKPEYAREDALRLAKEFRAAWESLQKAIEQSDAVKEVIKPEPEATPVPSKRGRKPKLPVTEAQD